MDFLMDFLKLDILVAQPQSFVYWLFTFSFLKPQPPNIIKRITILSVAHCTMTDISLLLLPLPIHVIFSFIAHAALLFLIFRDLSRRTKILLLVGQWLFVVAIESIFMYFMASVLGLNLHYELIRKDLPTLMMYLYPLLLLLLITSWFIRKRELKAAREVAGLLLDREKHGLMPIFVMVVLQVILLGISYLGHPFKDLQYPTVNRITIFLMIMLSVTILLYVIRLMIKTREKAIRKTQDHLIGDINQMFASIRGQRHDFINHVQVIHYFSHMGKAEELRQYIEELVHDTREAGLAGGEIHERQV